jgi:hypothetical protein
MMNHKKGATSSASSTTPSGLSGADTFHRMESSSAGSMTYAPHLSQILENAGSDTQAAAKAAKKMQLEQLMRLQSEGSFEMEVNGSVHSRGFQKESLSTTWQSFQARDKREDDVMQRAPSTPAIQPVGQGWWIVRKIRKACQPKHKSLDLIDTSSSESRMYVGGGSSVDMF